MDDKKRLAEESALRKDIETRCAANAQHKGGLYMMVGGQSVPADYDADGVTLSPASVLQERAAAAVAIAASVAAEPAAKRSK